MSDTPTTPSVGAAVNHLVLNVRDLEASHRFYTEIMGFEQCGELGPERPNKMRFYRGAPSHQASADNYPICTRRRRRSSG